MENIGAWLYLAIALFASVIVHEAAHVLAALRSGCKVESVKIGVFPLLKFTIGNLPVSVGPLIIFGRVSVDDASYESMSDKSKATMVAAGPAINAFVAICAFTICILLLISGSQPPVVSSEISASTGASSFTAIADITRSILGQNLVLGVFLMTAVINFSIAMVNLVPIPPFDGGRILFISLNRHFGDKARWCEEKITFAVLAAVVAITAYTFIKDIPLY